MALSQVCRAAAITVALVGSVFVGNLQAQSTGTIEGRVVDQAEAAVANAPVLLVPSGRQVISEADGRFIFANVPAGSWILRVSVASEGEGTERVEVASGETVRVTISLTTLFHLDALVVSAGPIAARQDELFQAATVLTADRLRERLQPSLGETLGNEPGVSSTYFGPGASRPVIRGLGGDRVRILESGIGTGDAANTSPDHAVSIDPASAERIEIVRGPATLLYGSAAVGGVVNVLDGRIPTERPRSAFGGGILGLAGSVAAERNLSGYVRVGAGPLVFRGVGSLLRTGDYTIPGFAELAHDQGEPGREEIAGVLDNSAVRNSSFGIGGSAVGARGFFGLSVSGVDSFYGVPVRHDDEVRAISTGQDAGEEEVRIDLRQRRVDLASELRFTEGIVEQIRVRAGSADYDHVELEGGETGTRFMNDQWEGRVEIRHRRLGAFTGAVGAQFVNRDFAAIGEEAFTPPSATDQLGLFAFEEAAAGRVRVQIGGRLERQETSAEGGSSRTFDGASLSGGLNWDVVETLSLAVSVARSVKLPTPEELFSDGPHLASDAYEVGDPDLTEEVARSIDATVHFHTDDFRGQVTLFDMDFSDFIHPAFTGEVVDGLKGVLYRQADVRLWGFEAIAETEIFHTGGAHVGLEVSADYVRGTLASDGSPLPRMPPLRFGGRLRFDGAPIRASLGARYVAAQDRTAEFESRTPSYPSLDASVSWRILRSGRVHELVLQGRNLTDADQRNHVSLLKDDVPMPGRDLRLMYRVAF